MKLEVFMSQSVTIKSNKYGINLVLNPDVAFDDLLKDVVEKFKASSSFFKNAKLALAFEGRALSDDEEQQIIAAIEKNTTIEQIQIPKVANTEIVTERNINSRVTDSYGTTKIDNQSNYTITEEMLIPDVEIQNKKNILIYHTHTCESYTASERI